MSKSISAALLKSIETISHETTLMLTALDGEVSLLAAGDRREAKRRVLELRVLTQELLDWLSEMRLEEPTN